MFGVILKAINSSFQEVMTFCRSIYVKKVMKLLAFIFESPRTGARVGARVLDSVNHMTLKLLKNCILGAKMPKFWHLLPIVIMDVIICYKI